MDTTLDTEMECSELIMITDHFNAKYLHRDNTNFNQTISANSLTQPQLSMPFNSQAAVLQQQSISSPFHKMLAACSGAIITSIFTTPLDVVKTRLQLQRSFNSSIPKSCRNLFFSSQNTKHHHLSSQAAVGSSLNCTCPATSAVATQVAARQLNGTLDGVVKIVRYEGITSLWRGLSPALIMSVPATVIYFVGYEYLRDLMWARWKGKTPETYAPLLAGATARTIAATTISPIELFRTRLQGPEGSNGLRGVMSGVQSMVRANGISSLWRGLGPTLWRDVPFSAIYWSGYEFIKRNINNHGDFKLSEFEISFVSGATSGMIAAILTTPFDVAKTKRQVASNNVKPHRMFHIMRTVVQEEGYSGLMRGVVPRIVKIAPACAIMIISFFQLKHNMTIHLMTFIGFPFHLSFRISIMFLVDIADVSIVFRRNSRRVQPEERFDLEAIADVLHFLADTDILY
ncbi:hypothetical protein G9A89_008338 [Geosiphon pyriformis]|nr:hypothetical protein G9A89_008338 [Geosiphon pyriformis]